MSKNDDYGSLAQRFRLTQDELVIRHQLNILFYSWEREKAPTLVSSDFDSPAEELPPKWSLLGGTVPHAWQNECCEKWFCSGLRGVVKVVTGAGKTILALRIIERLQNGDVPELRVAVVVPTIVLMDQWCDLLAQHSNLPPHAIGRLGGDFQDSFGGSVRILVCVLNSAAAKLAKLAEKSGGPLLLVVDECHRAGATQMSRVFATQREFNLGLSATPEREEVGESEEDLVKPDTAAAEDFDASLLGKELGPIIYEMDYRQALEAGILSRFRIHHYGLPLEAGERSRYERLSRDISELRRHLQSQLKGPKIDGGALVGWARRVAAQGKSALARQAAEYVSLTGQRKQLLYHAKARGDAVVRLIGEALQTDPDSRIILFHEVIADVMRLFLELRRQGYAVVAEHSKLPDSLRDESIRLFRSGAAKVLVSARSLIEGFDVPAADVGVVVASSSSVRQRVQTLGRILRKKAGAAADKPAVLHVLYMAETTDEMIYEKQDWEAVTGAECNAYFQWDSTDESKRPVEQAGPPRRPRPGEASVDWSRLKPGDVYPGVYEGDEFNSDAQDNVRDAGGELIVNPQDAPAVVHSLRGGYGRFRVTQRKRAILVPVTRPEGSQILFGGFLQEPFKVGSPQGRGTEVETATTIRGLAVGENYDGPLGKAMPLKVINKAAGYVISRRIKGGEAYARTTAQAESSSCGGEAEAVIRAVVQVEKQENAKIRKISLASNGVVYCEVGGRRIFLHQLIHGLEFTDRVVKSA